MVEVIINRSMPGRDNVNRLSAWKTWKLGKAGKMDDSEIPEISHPCFPSRYEIEDRLKGEWRGTQGW